MKKKKILIFVDEIHADRRNTISFRFLMIHLVIIIPHAVFLQFGILSKSLFNFSFTSLKSNSFCILSQNFELVPKYFERRKAISTEIFLFP